MRGQGGGDTLQRGTGWGDRYITERGQGRGLILYKEGSGVVGGWGGIGT